MKNPFAVITFAAIISGLMVALPNSALAQTVFAIDDDLKKYWLVEAVAPHYPKIALRYSTEGCITIGFFIQPDGSIDNHKILAAIPPSDVFVNSALDALKEFTFIPSEQKPEKIKIFTIRTFVYEITSDSNNSQQEKKVASMFKRCKSEAMNLLGKGTSEA